MVARPVPCRRVILCWLALVVGIAAAATPAGARRRILFVGNSFTFGANSPVEHYRSGSVTDLNGDGVSGVPALFARFAAEAGLRYDVSLETAGGQSLAWHWSERRDRLDRRWDRVVLQDYSTLDRLHPGDPAELIASTRLFAAWFARRNRRVAIDLVATWSRPDQTYPEGGAWHGRPITAMADDLRRGYDRARAANPRVDAVAPVGQAFSCAIARGIADPDPYDGLAAGQIDLWSFDHYHASTAGYYLEALTIFATVTGRDPRRLGAAEQAAAELVLPPALAVRLQRVAWAAVHDRCDG